jgi:hypothetical protein
VSGSFQAYASSHCQALLYVPFSLEFAVDEVTNFRVFRESEQHWSSGEAFSHVIECRLAQSLGVRHEVQDVIYVLESKTQVLTELIAREREGLLGQQADALAAICD